MGFVGVVGVVMVGSGLGWLLLEDLWRRGERGGEKGKREDEKGCERSYVRDEMGLG